VTATSLGSGRAPAVAERRVDGREKVPGRAKYVDQHGLSDQAVVMTAWDPKSGNFIGVSGLHGTPLPK
jgi:hypothetical protein